MNNLSIEEQKNIFGGSEVGRSLSYALGRIVSWMLTPRTDVRMHLYSPVA